MAEENSNPVFQIQRMYLKDLSLEIPHAPHIFLEQAQPTVEVAIDNGHEKVHRPACAFHVEMELHRAGFFVRREDWPW